MKILIKHHACMLLDPVDVLDHHRTRRMVIDVNADTRRAENNSRFRILSKQLLKQCNQRSFKLFDIFGETIQIARFSSAQDWLVKRKIKLA